MKISSVKIRNFRQFKDIELDLTYPLGHEKEGQPLDKVCFIGQSGSGKTTLLRAIFDLCIPLMSSPSNQYKSELDFQSGIFGKIEHRNMSYTKVLVETGNRISRWGDFRIGKIFVPDEDTNDFTSKFEKGLKEDNVKMLFFPDALAHKPQKNITFNNDQFIFDFTQIDVIGIWHDMLTQMTKWSEKETELSLQLLDNRNDQKKTEELKLFIEKWYKENPHPTESLGLKLDVLLERFFLEVERGVNPNFSRANKNISIAHSISKESIEYNALSSGIQSIIFKTLPLYLYKPQEGVVIIDEIDASLYIDVQRSFINYLQELSPSAQFFFSSHSPVILSSFEPWEIVELIFTEQGFVQQRKYYFESEGRHVDNYFIWPQYLRWDDIIMKSFGTDVEGNEDIRDLELTMAARLKKQLNSLIKSKKQNTEEYKTILSQYLKSARKIGWNYAED